MKFSLIRHISFISHYRDPHFCQSILHLHLMLDRSLTSAVEVDDSCIDLLLFGYSRYQVVLVGGSIERCPLPLSSKLPFCQKLQGVIPVLNRNLL